MRRLFYIVPFFLLIFVSVEAKKEVDKRKQFFKSMSTIKVLPPTTPPAQGQDSIDLAMTMYGIELPPNTQYPKYDPDLADRGLTMMATFSDLSIVSIGPPAFDSWALLGSTLAHEIEIHCKQRGLLILAKDFARLDGTGEAEREAYCHEVRNAERFGLSKQETQDIHNTMAYFYPNKETGHVDCFSQHR